VADGVPIPLVPQITSGRRLENILTDSIDATIIGIELTSTAPFRRWPGSYEKNYQAVNLDIEPVGNQPISVIFEVGGSNSTSVTFPITGAGRRITGRMRFPKTMHGQAIAYRIVSEGRWRLWGGELLYQVLGSREHLQRQPITSPGGAVGPDVQKSSFDQTVMGPEPQKSSLDRVNSLDGQVQKTSIVTAA
jgi:hypothetical protein